MIIEFSHVMGNGDAICFTAVEVDVQVAPHDEGVTVTIKEHFCRKCRHRYTKLELEEIRDNAIEIIESAD